MGKTRFQRVRRFYGCMEPLAAFHHRDCAGRNVRDNESFLRAGRTRSLDAEQQMVRLANQLRTGSWSGVDHGSWIVVRQMGPQYWRLRHASGLWRSNHSAIR